MPPSRRRPSIRALNAAKQPRDQRGRFTIEASKSQAPPRRRSAAAAAARPDDGDVTLEIPVAMMAKLAAGLAAGGLAYKYGRVVRETISSLTEPAEENTPAPIAKRGSAFPTEDFTAFLGELPEREPEYVEVEEDTVVDQTAIVRNQIRECVDKTNELLDVFRNCMRKSEQKKNMIPSSSELTYSDAITDEKRLLALIKSGFNAIDKAVTFLQPKPNQQHKPEEGVSTDEDATSYETPPSTPEVTPDRNALALCDTIAGKTEQATMDDLKTQLDLINTFEELQRGDFLTKFNQFLTATLN